ncbi:response regulator transcription factor [Microbacterium insulae]|uniref:Response regulator transcription factor n=1 Tax=Microbacterium insulae TaxID=483014 RepID=A0ABW3AGY3_9MICO
MATDVNALVVSDDALMSSALARLLIEDAAIAVSAARARGSAEVVRACHHVGPDVVIVDLGDDASATGEVAAGIPSAVRGVISLVRHDDPGLIAQMFAAGACGVVSKDAEPGELVRAVREVSAGHLFASRTAMRLVLDELASPRPTSARHPVAAAELRARALAQNDRIVDAR